MSEKPHFRIDVEANFLDQQSDPFECRFAFSYTISIHNRGTSRARLMTRHWIITDANGRTKEVRGDGVVGKQPEIAPGEIYRYSSGAILDTPVGSMHGSYGMLADDGTPFSAPIAPFTLAAPRSLN